MPIEMQSNQRLFLWTLAISPQGNSRLKDMRLKLRTASQRKQLVSLGLIRTSGRPMVVELTDAGWEWCQDNLTTPLEGRSSTTGVVLQGLLKSLASYFQAQDHTVSIGHLIQQADALEVRDVAQPHRTIESAIESACLKLGGNRANVRVRLGDLRPLLAEFSPASVDQALLAMELSGRLTAMRLDNPDEISEADRAAVLLTPSGSENHILYLQGTQPCY